MHRFGDGFFIGVFGGAVLLAAFACSFVIGLRVGMNFVIDNCKQYGAHHDDRAKLECKALP
jgi:hypothetical protein